MSINHRLVLGQKYIQLFQIYLQRYYVDDYVQELILQLQVLWLFSGWTLSRKRW